MDALTQTTTPCQLLLESLCKVDDASKVIVLQALAGICYYSDAAEEYAFVFVHLFQYH